jgi:hypothetical protein
MANGPPWKGKAGGNNATDALEKALDVAWRKAKADGYHDAMRVEKWLVKGENPLNWSSVVLVPDQDSD